MARASEHNGFLCIEATAAEMIEKCHSYGICDYCGKPSLTGTYIAVLNQWLCPNCLEDFKRHNRQPYAEDEPFERKHYRTYATLLGLA